MFWDNNGPGMFAITIAFRIVEINLSFMSYV